MRAGCDAERVTVRRCLRDRIGADVAARARTVFNDHLLIPYFAELLREYTSCEVRAAARGVRHDDAHGP
jgi:hypothetical protein